MLNRTPLYTAHQRLGAKLIEFGGWEMPVQYSSIVDEHLCVRRSAGVFDICHMGELFVTGSQAADFLNACLTNDIRKLAIGQGQYTLMCQETGGVVDDLYVYRLEDNRYLLILNASRIDRDVAWLQLRLENLLQSSAGTVLDPASNRFGAIALQGPRVAEYIDQVFSGPSVGGWDVGKCTDLKKNQVGTWLYQGETVWVARTGYTGEDGFEVIAPAESVEAIWNRALSEGHRVCQQPCGLGARDTLRTEVCFPLYGHELDENTTPIEAGLGSFVSLEKGDFCGRNALASQKSEGVAKKLVAFRMTGKSAPPRPGYPIWVGGQLSGTTVSGTQSPSLNTGIGMGFVPPSHTEPGTIIEIEIRGQRHRAEVVRKPLFRKTSAPTQSTLNSTNPP